MVTETKPSREAGRGHSTRKSDAEQLQAEQELLEGWDVDLDVEYDESQPTQSKKFVDPYRMKRNLVRIKHFVDARCQDPELEAGFVHQPWYARKLYRQWLDGVRKNPGWEGFRRPPIIIREEIEQIDGSIIIIQKKLPYTKVNAERNALGGKNRRTYTISLSKEKGVKPDDPDYRPKMFTPKMGQLISHLRQEKGMMQTDLAKKINVDISTIRNIETGGLLPFNPEDVVVKSLAKVLGVPTIKYQE